MIIPNELLCRRIWVCRDEKKVPYQPLARAWASSTNPRHWTDYRTASRAAWTHGFAGVSFAVGNGIVAIDLDDCFDYRLTNQAQQLVERIDSYTEFSVSGAGVHIVALGSLTTSRRVPGLELYSWGRFMAFTGCRYPDSAYDVQDRDMELKALLRELSPEVEHHEAPRLASSAVQLPDDLLIEQLLRSNKKAAKLWSGDCSDYVNADGSPDHSRADMALTAILSLWTVGDRERIKRLFRQSGLYRSKWDSHTYADRTISAVL